VVNTTANAVYHPKTGAEGILPVLSGALGALLAGLLLALAAAKRRREISQTTR